MRNKSQITHVQQTLDLSPRKVAQLEANGWPQHSQYDHGRVYTWGGGGGGGVPVRGAQDFNMSLYHLSDGQRICEDESAKLGVCCCDEDRT